MFLRMFNSKGKKVAEFNPDDGVLMIPADDLRDRFATAIMGGFAANASEMVLFKTPRQCAEHAYKCADAMMEARKS